MAVKKMLGLGMVWVFILSFASFLGPSPTFAQTPNFSLVTSPLPILLTTTPGKTVTTELRVRNASSQSERLKVNLYKFSANDEGQISLQDRQPGDDFMNWVSFSPREFEAAPNEWRKVKMTINVPKSAAFGYYYAVGFARADRPTPTPGAASLEGQVVTFVLLEAQVPGAKRQLEVTEFSADKSSYEFLPATMTVKVKNTGNIHLTPGGDIFVKRGDKAVATLNINPNQGSVLPGSSRTYKAQWKDGFPRYVEKVGDDGNPVITEEGVAANKLEWDFSKVPDLRIGKYTADMLLIYDDGQRDVPIEGKVSFWVIPWRLLLVLLVVLILVGIGLWSSVKKVWRGAKKLKK